MKKFLLAALTTIALSTAAYAQVPSKSLETLYLANHGMCEGGVCPTLKHCRVLFAVPPTKQCGGAKDLANLMLVCDGFLEARKDRKGCDDIVNYVETCSPETLE